FFCGGPMCRAGDASFLRPGSSSPPRAFVIAAPAAPHAPSLRVMPGTHIFFRLLSASHHPFDRLSSPLRLEPHPLEPRSSPPRGPVIAPFERLIPRTRRNHHPDHASSRTFRVVSAPPPAVVIA